MSERRRNTYINFFAMHPPYIQAPTPLAMQCSKYTTYTHYLHTLPTHNTYIHTSTFSPCNALTAYVHQFFRHALHSRHAYINFFAMQSHYMPYRNMDLPSVR